MLCRNLVCPLGKAARVALRIGPALAVALALAAPAAAGEIYAWRTDDGSYAFADDRRRIPERYRDRVEVRESRSLRDHERFTPADDEAVGVYAAGLEQRLERLRRMNAQMDGQIEAERQARMAQDGGVTVRFSSDGEPIVDVPPGLAGRGGEPVIIEDVIARERGGIRTRTNTVVRRGDEIIAVIRPFDATPRLDHPTEEELDAGEFDF